MKVEINSLIEIETGKLRREISNLKTENLQLKESLKSTNTALDELDQYGRRMCLEISNIPGDNGSFTENVEEKVLFLTASKNVDLNASDIDKCHRLGRHHPDSATNRRIIVKFTNSKARQRVYEARRSLGDGTFVQDHLTRLRSQLGFEARKLVRSKALNKTWVAGSKIYAPSRTTVRNIRLPLKTWKILTLCMRVGKLPTPVSFPTNSHLSKGLACALLAEITKFGTDDH